MADTWGQEVEPDPDPSPEEIEAEKIRAIFDRILWQRVEAMLAQYRPPDATLH